MDERVFWCKLLMNVWTAIKSIHITFGLTSFLFLILVIRCLDNKGIIFAEKMC